MSKQALVVFLLSAACATSQTTNTLIFGTVTDSSGAVLAGVSVVATKADTQVAQTVLTNAGGNYVLPGLRPGTYTVTCEQQGFKKFVREGVLLEVDQRARVDVGLQVGEVRDSISVQGEVSTVDTFSSTIKEVVDPKRMVDLPLNGRRSLQLQNLLAGAVQTRPFQAASLIAQNTDMSFSVNGARPNASSFFLDGGINMDTYNNLATAFPNPDALQEFSILQNSYSAVNGRNAGVVVNMVTKSGTNNLHGTLYEFLRNEKLNTRNFFSIGKPPLKKNQFGGTVGGPVRLPGYNGKDRTFFFFSYEANRERNGTTRSDIRLPSALERQGDFSRTTLPAGRAVADPATVTAANPQGAPFPNNTIPASRLDGVAQKFSQAFFPSPNLPGNFYSYNFSVPLTDDQFTMKLDHSFSNSNKASLRWFYDDNRRLQNEALESFNSEFNWTTHNATLNDTHIFSPTVVNNFTFTLNRNTFIRGPLANKVSNWDTLGCVSCPYLAPSSVAPDWQVQIANGFGVRVSTAFFSYMQNYQLVDNLSVTKGNHLITLGGDLAKIRRNGREYFQVSPTFVFDGLRSGAAYGYADFFLGAPRSVFQNSPLRSNPHKWTPFLYVQDDWKISRKLTLNLGIRWEPYFPVVEERDELTAFRPGQQSTVLPLAPRGLLFPGDTGISRGVVGHGFKKFSPRFGFAYDPFGNGKTSIRGGYGIFYDTLRIVGVNGYSTSQPFSLGITTFDPFSLTDPYRNAPTIPGRLVAYGSATKESRKSTAFVPQVVANSIDPNFTTGYMQQWNLSVQREVAAEMVVTGAYVASKGTHSWVGQNINPGVFIPGQSTPGNLDSRRLYQPFANINNLQPTANSTYHSLQLSWKKRFSKGYSVLGSYTWSKFIDLASSDTGANNPFNWKEDKGRSDFDIRHRFVTSFIYELPLFNKPGLQRKLLGGWQVNGIVTLQTGQPFSIAAGQDRSLSGGGTRADSVAPATAFNDKPRGQKVFGYLDKAQFGLPALGSHGNAGRNILSAPGMANVDFSAFKDFRLNESKRFEFRWEIFNLFNRPNFFGPNSNWSSAQFGWLNSARDPRIMQAGLKFIY